MATGLIDIMKRAALDAVDNAKISDLRFGIVSSESPLKIRVSGDFILPESVLIVPEHLTNYTIPIDIEWGISSGGDPTHTHEISNATSITINAALKEGDKVALLRKQGGQSYYVLGRI